VRLTAGEVKWSDIIWSDVNGLPGVWSDLESDGGDAFAVAADGDVTIVMSGNEAVRSIAKTGDGRVRLVYKNIAVPDGMTNALMSAAWTGIVSLTGTRTLTNFDFSRYGNAGSAIELAGSPSGSLKPNGCCASELILAPYCQVTLTGGTKGSTYVFSGALSGSGEFYYGGTTTASQLLCFTGDTSRFRGCVNATYNSSVAFGPCTYHANSNNMVIVNTSFTYSANTKSYVSGSIVVYGNLTFESGVVAKGIGYNASNAPVKLASPTARVLVRKGCGMSVVGVIPGLTLLCEETDGDRLYRYDYTVPTAAGTVFTVQ